METFNAALTLFRLQAEHIPTAARHD